MPPSHASGPSNHITTPLGTTKENYIASTPQIPRYPYQSHENSGFLPDYPQSSTLNSARQIHPALSPSTSNTFNMSHSHMQLTGPTRRTDDAPPFAPTKMLHQLSSSSSKNMMAELSAKIDKGFFKADDDWTCYRRNYFAVACSFTLKPPVNTKSEPLYLHRSHHMEQIKGFAMSITARVDNEDGKVVELVQHTPKRDKGPMGPPEKITIIPHAGSAVGYGDSSGSLSPSHQLTQGYDTYSPSNPQTVASIANFDRIQFKNATANNGKRRAAQQYFHVLVELYANVPSKNSAEGSWVKVATRLSAAMVVRGRSPGHYSDERRGSSTSMGPGGGSSGDSNSSMRDPTSGGGNGSRPTGTFSLSRGSRDASGTYISHQADGHYASSESNSDPSLPPIKRGVYQSVRHLGNVILTKEEANTIDTFDGYQYYPATLFETPAHGRAGHERQQSAHSGPPRGEATSPGYRNENGNRYSPHGVNGHHKMEASRSCGSSFRAEGVGLGISPFVGVNSSHGIYPAAPTI